MKHRIAAVVATGLAVAFAAPAATASAAGPQMTARTESAGPLGSGIVVTLNNTSGRVIGGCIFELHGGGQTLRPGQLRAGQIPVGSTWSGMFPPVPPGKYTVGGRCHEPFRGASDVVTPKFFWKKQVPVSSRSAAAVTRSAATVCPPPRQARPAVRRARRTPARSTRRPHGSVRPAPVPSWPR